MSRTLIIAGFLMSLAMTADARVLTREFLTGSSPLVSPVPTSEFVPPANAAEPGRFAGRLSLSRESILGSMTIHRDTFGSAQLSEGKIGHLPEFDFDFVQDGGSIIPVRRGYITNDNPYWEFILEPGLAWRDPEDGGMSRIALPFALQERNANCVHNGLLMFLFDERTVSRVAYQITSETCAYFQADLWGVLPARLASSISENRHAVVAAYRREVGARLPTKPMAAMPSDFPGVDTTRFGNSEEIEPADMTAYGFVIDGKHYVGGCMTRFGPYPFCDVLDLPSYSLAKTLVGGLATLRMEKLFPGLLRLKIATQVPECSDSRRWGAVTFEHALNMTTGNYTDPTYDVDESARRTIDFFLVEDHAAKIHMACNQHPHREAPGTRWVYHTTDTYILGTALAGLLQNQAGPNADFYADVLVRTLWQPLGLSPLMNSTRRTRDRKQQPFTGWGLVFHRDDIARIGQFLTRDRGRLGGAAFFDERAFDAAMQRDDRDTGPTAIDSLFRYNKGFWSHDISHYIGCDRPVWVPYMAGYGGINVLLFPNDTVYYYFSDGGTFRWSQAAIESNRLRSMCGSVQ